MKRCSDEYHESLKVDRAAFEAATERMPHHQHAEAIATGLWYRNCRECKTTIAFILDVGDERDESATLLGRGCSGGQEGPGRSRARAAFAAAASTAAANVTLVGRPDDHALPPLMPACEFEEMPPWWQWASDQLALDDTAAAVMEWK